MSWARGWVLLGASLAVAMAAAVVRPAAAPRSSPEEVHRGRALFHRGVTASGEPLRALLGEEGVELSGQAAACANCHHSTGRGSQEGGVAAPDITARSLSRVRPEGTPGRTAGRPAYDVASLARAIQHGVDPAGRRLSIAMPHFVLSEQDMSALASYLSVLGEEKAPGVSDQALRVGALLPLSGPRAPMGQDVRDVLQAAIAEVNAEGGVYRRRLELIIEDESGAGAAQARLLETGVVALLNGVQPRDGHAEEESPPILMALPATDVPSGEAIFALYSGLSVQARVAMQHGMEADPKALHWAVVAPEDAAGRQWLAGVRTETSRREGVTLREHLYLADARSLESVVAALRRDPPSAILFGGTLSELQLLVAGLGNSAQQTAIYAPLMLGRPDGLSMAPEVARRVRFVSPVPLEAALHSRSPEFRSFLQRHSLSERHWVAQVSGYVSVKLLVEGLKRAGSGVTQAGLVAALESMRDFETPLTPPVSFGPSRRVGLLGASLVQMDPAANRLLPLASWRELTP
ncbi:cytochrome c family protein [Hyalangium minutum]|uniref:Cytochrome c family protein n=2 Tax=Hyalangium minutum TaxID=394096 RepID=A0A085W977_9BACT|nr:cytochrome c family protein [Hyalangium minutum]